MDEQDDVVVECKVHWLRGWLWILLAILFIVDFIDDMANGSFSNVPVAVFCVIVAILIAKSESLTLYTDRVVGKRGLIRVRKQVSPVWKIQDVVTDQTLFGRLFGYYTIGVNTAGTGKSEYTYTFITNAEEFQEAFIELQKAERDKAKSA